MHLAAIRVRLGARTAIALLAAAATLLAATGIVQLRTFQYPSSLKYALTILAPLVVLMAATVKRSLRAITATAIVAGPFVDATASIGGTRVSVLVPALLSGAVLASLSCPPVGRPASLAAAGVLAFPLLAVPLVIGSANRPFITTLALLLAVAWLVSRTAEEPGGMTAVLMAMAASAAIQSAIAIWQARTGHQLNLYSSAGSSQFSSDYFYAYGSTRRPPGAFNDPISLGNMLAISLPLVSVLAVHVRSSGARAVLVAIALVTGVALALSLSRAPWIGALAGMGVTLVLLPRATRRSVLPIAVTGLAAIAAAAFVLAGPAVRGRFLSLRNPTAVQGQPSVQQGVAEGDRHRLEYWRVAFEDGFLQHPIAGIGVDKMEPFLVDRVANFGPAIRPGTLGFLSAHSTYLQLLGEGGLFALALLLLLFRGLLKDARAGLRAYPILGAGLAGAAVALLICWTTDWVVHYEPVAACVAVLLGALAAAGRAGSQVPSAPAGGYDG